MKQTKEELLECLEDLEQTLTKLDQVVDWLKSENQKMADMFKDDEDYTHYLSPLNSVTGYDFEKTIREVKHNSCDFVVKQMSRFYKNITLDADTIWKQFKETGFFPTAVYGYINLMCIEEDKLALDQIKTHCVELLPYGTYGKGLNRCRANKPELIINRNSLVLHEHVYYDRLYHGIIRIRALINFTWITLKGSNPADVEPKGEILNETGIISYQDELIKSIRIYKNGNVKITFRNPAHTAIMGKALTDLVVV